MSKSRNPGYQGGNNWGICDRCGQAYRQTELVDQHDGLRVCVHDCYDKRHPQEAVRDKGWECGGSGAQGTGLDWNGAGRLARPDVDPLSFIQEPNDAYFTTIPTQTVGVACTCPPYIDIGWWFNNQGDTTAECYDAYTQCLAGLDDTALYIALDLSGSMVDNTSANGLTRLQNAKNVLTGLLTQLKEVIDSIDVDIMIVGWSKVQQDQMTKRAATSSDLDDLITHINGMGILGDDYTWFWKGTELSSAFYTASPANYKRLCWFITDGEPYYSASEQRGDFLAQTAADYLFSVSGVESYGVNIDLTNTFYTQYVDNTPVDGVPIITWD